MPAVVMLCDVCIIYEIFLPKMFHLNVLMPLDPTSTMDMYRYIYSLPTFKNVFLLTFRGRGRERERKRHVRDQLPPLCTPTGDGTLTWVCSLSGNQTSNHSVHRMTLNQLRHTNQVLPHLLHPKWECILHTFSPTMSFGDHFMSYRAVFHCKALS